MVIQQSEICLVELFFTINCDCSYCHIQILYCIDEEMCILFSVCFLMNNSFFLDCKSL